MATINKDKVVDPKQGGNLERDRDKSGSQTGTQRKEGGLGADKSSGSDVNKEMDTSVSE